MVQGVLQLVLQTPVPTHVWPQSSYWGLLVYGLCVMALEFAPLGGVNPKEVAEYLSASNVGIRGVIPGDPTEKHIQSQLLRCKFWVRECSQAVFAASFVASFTTSASLRLFKGC